LVPIFERELSVMEVSIVGLDLAKHVFQLHDADARGRPVLRRKLRRTQMLRFFQALPPCRVAMEAGASAHHWARELRALGHAPVLIPPQFVRPFVKTNKSDAADAEAIVEAALRPTMRFAAVKSAEQQSVLTLHRARELLVRQRTMLINAIRSLCGEFGLTVAQGAPNACKLVAIIRDVDDPRLPDLGRTALKTLAGAVSLTRTGLQNARCQGSQAAS
jgi:transposase